VSTLQLFYSRKVAKTVTITRLAS